MQLPQFVRQNWLARLVQKFRSKREPSRHSRTCRLWGMESLEPRFARAGVVNGSFEQDIVTANGNAWELYGNIAGWTRTLGNYVELQRGILGGAAHGSQHMELDTDGPTSISQTITTVAGQAYKLRFSFAGRPGTATTDNILRVSAYNVDGGQTALSFSLVDDVGNRVSDNLPQLPGGSGWRTYEAIVVAAGTQTKIEFGDAGNTANGLGTFLDNVSFEETTETPPPVNLIVNGGFERHIVTDNSNTWHLYTEVTGTEIPGWELELGDQVELQRGILGGPS